MMYWKAAKGKQRRRNTTHGNLCPCPGTPEWSSRIQRGDATRILRLGFPVEEAAVPPTNIKGSTDRAQEMTKDMSQISNPALSHD